MTAGEETLVNKTFFGTNYRTFMSQFANQQILLFEIFLELLRFSGICRRLLEL